MIAAIAKRRDWIICKVLGEWVLIPRGAKFSTEFEIRMELYGMKRDEACDIFENWVSLEGYEKTQK